MSLTRINDLSSLSETAYAAQTSGYDEWFDAEGELRPDYRPLAEAIAGLGKDRLNAVWERARLQLFENGVTYNIYREGQELRRPWSLDPLPIVFSEDHWRTLEQGLLQRAQILNLLLADVYGPQRLLRERILPVELIFANPGFLRSCAGFNPTRGIWLHRYAVDLGRSVEGQWLAISDRTQAPAGSGFALENRIVTHRLYPQVLRESNVRRLAEFFKRYLNTLVELLPPARQEEPHIVLLGPGSEHEAYFEHSYLAKYLGLNLVEDADLTVRDEIVYLKTLEGLVQVDAIIRRVEDWTCDPLWMNDRSNSGIPGLTQAARAGKVLIANALGSGVLETPALLPYLPELCRFFLAQEPRIPSVRTWWCGDPDSLRFVLSRFDSLIIKSAFPMRTFETVFASDLDSASREELKLRIQAAPHTFIAQEKLNLSTAPVWDGSSLQPHHLMLRAHVVARPDGSYAAMAGGFTRVAPISGSLSVTQKRGGACKDTWVVSTRPVEQISLLPKSGEPLELRRAPRNLPSRLADNLFWMSRYLERAEADLRLVRMLLTRFTDLLEFTENAEMQILAGLISEQFNVPLPSENPHQEGINADQMHAFLYQLIDLEGADRNIRTTLGRLRALTWKVRDRISSDAWRILTVLDRDARYAPQNNRLSLNDWQDRINRMLTGLAAFSGLEMESMTRATGWRFLDMGRRLERAMSILELVRRSITDLRADEAILLKLILEMLDSAMTYRSRYVDEIQTGAVVDLIVLDETNPRSVAFQVEALAGHAAMIPRNINQAVRSREERLALSALNRLRMVEVYDICEIDPDGRREKLEDFCTSVGDELSSFSDTLSLAYFSHAEELRLMSKQKS
ncbi:MAG: hypothetical protein GC154_13115 [bacterium]|nr:hypothetical protein [bacterium]